MKSKALQQTRKYVKYSTGDRNSGLSGFLYLNSMSSVFVFFILDDDYRMYPFAISNYVVLIIIAKMPS